MSDKRVTVNLDRVFSLGTNYSYYQLSPQHIEVLLNIFPQLTWAARWTGTGGKTSDEIQEFMGDLAWRLMNPEDCPAPEVGDCYGYPPYASTVSFSPMNPYTNPNEIPNDWLAPPFYIYDGGGSLPLQYIAGDIIVPFSALTLNPFDVFGGQLPTIQIQVTGPGQVELDILAIGNGGLCAITLNQAPSLAEILSGQFSPGTVVIDTNLDFSLPSEDDVSVQHEVDIQAQPMEVNTVFLTFMPVIDDQLFSPVRFGGGFRAFQLCGFEQGGTIVSAITNIRLNGCNLEALEGGIWLNKGTIVDCITPYIDNLQNQISGNDADILNLQNENTNQQNQIDLNTTNILSLDNRVTQTELSIVGLNAITDNHETRIGQTELSIVGLNAITDDHETRITALENASDGGDGGQNIKTTAYAIEIVQNWNNTDTAFIDVVSFLHEFTYENFMIIAEAKTQSANSATQAIIRLAVGTTDGTLEGWATGVSPVSTQVSQVFENMVTGSLSVRLQLATSVFGSYARLNTDQKVQFSIIEYSSPVVTTSQIVTFDDGGKPYTLVPGQVGSVNPVGNTGNALQGQNMAHLEYIAVEWSTPSGIAETINDVQFDFYVSDVIVADAQLWIDGSLIQFGQLDTFSANQWQTFIWMTHDTGLPLSGTDVQIRIVSNQSGETLTDARLDNLSMVVA